MSHASDIQAPARERPGDSLWSLTGSELRDAYGWHRENDPVIWDDETRSWLVFGYDVVVSILRDHETYVQAFLPEQPEERFAPWNAFKRANMIDLNPPDHRRLRGLVARSFTPRYSEELRPWIRSLAREQIRAAIAARGAVDVIGDVSEPLAVAVIARLLGVPVEDQGSLRHWGDTITRMYEPRRDPEAVDAALDALAEFSAYIEHHADRARQAPGDGLLSLLVSSSGDDALTDQEIVSTAILLLNGGHETSVNALGNAVVALLDDHDAFSRLREDRDLVRTAADELLRYESPLRTFPRRAAIDTSVHGTPVAAGDLITLMLESANRDSQAFARANALVLDREPNRHVAFGTGIHICLGAPVARIELQESLDALLDLVPAWRLAQEPDVRPSFQFNGYTSLQLQR